MDLETALSFLFGTEEHVSIRRELIQFSEDLYNRLTRLQLLNWDETLIYSGSAGEGVAYPKSDDDLMICSGRLRLVKTKNEAAHDFHLLMIPSDDSPAYCLLVDVKHSLDCSIFFPLNETPIVSSILLKLCIMLGAENDFKENEIDGFLLRTISKRLIQLSIKARTPSIFPLEPPVRKYLNGPCINLSTSETDYEFDTLFCFRCLFWPDVANEWGKRLRSHDWPSFEMVQNIVEHGCHVVPIGDKDSPLYLHEWRLSFSVAEKALIHSFNHVQFLTYSLLKLLFKRIIEKRFPDVLCSYHIKTTMFYVAEKISPNFWKVSEFETCVKASLGMLHDFIDQKYCPNYFIQDSNMIRRKVNQTNRCVLLDLLKTLHINGIVKNLHLCGESLCMKHTYSCYFLKTKLDHDMRYSFLFLFAKEHFLKVLSMSLGKELESSANIVFTIISILSRIQNERLQGLFFNSGLFFSCQKVITDVLGNLKRVNKSNYRLHKTIEVLLRIGYSRDVTIGKNITATYMYLLGRTEYSLLHIRRMLSEFPFHDHGSPSIREMISFICKVGRRFDKRGRSFFTFDSSFDLQNSFMYAFPKAFRIWIGTCDLIGLDLLLYAHALESLCYIRLQNHTSLMKSTRFLVNHINDMHSIYKNKRQIKMCVGIIKYSQGENQSACRWFGSALLTKNAWNEIMELQSPEFIYIACLLNKRFMTKSGVASS